jgi:uncharacterized protein YukE
VAIELPQPVVDFLQVIGVNWPNVNEDAVREFAAHTREFAANIGSAHAAASATVQQMGEAYSGASYQQLVSTWARMSSDHMTELVDVCTVLADALDVAADAIVAAKGAAIGELIGLAASFVADQAAAVLTFGIAEAAEAAVIEAAKLCVNYLEQEILQHIESEVLGKALEPLEAAVARAVQGLVYSGVAAAAGAGSAGAGAQFGIQPDILAGHAETMRAQADAVSGYAADFSAKVGAVSFE